MLTFSVSVYQELGICYRRCCPPPFLYCRKHYSPSQSQASWSCASAAITRDSKSGLSQQKLSLQYHTGLTKNCMGLNREERTVRNKAWIIHKKNITTNQCLCIDIFYNIPNSEEVLIQMFKSLMCTYVCNSI